MEGLGSAEKELDGGNVLHVKHREKTAQHGAPETALAARADPPGAPTFSHEPMVRAAIIGVGGIAKLHATSLKELGIELCGCCCRTAAKGEAFAAEFGTIWYADYESLLAKEAPDFVIITTPSGSHLEPALACFASGVAVLCEKPLETTTARADLMVAAAERSGLLLGGIFQARFSPALLALHGAARDGHFGQLAVLSAQVPWWRADEYYAPPRWQGTLALDGGGAFINQAIHSLDVLLWIGSAAAGEVVEVSAYTANRSHAHTQIEVEDTGVAVLRFADGTLGSALAATSLFPGGKRRVLVGGKGGTVEIEDDAPSRWDFAAAGAPARPAGGGLSSGGASDPLAIPHAGIKANIEAFAAALGRASVRAEK